MANAVLMPKAGITVESCIIGKWEKKVGDQVAEGDVLFTYETDKATFECESTAAGELLEVFYGNGDEVPCLENVCAIGRKGEDVSALRPGAAAAHEPANASADPASPIVPAAPAAAVNPADRVAISPRAGRLAERGGVDAARAFPTGPRGRIIERDVCRLMEEDLPAPVRIASAETVPEVPAPIPAALAADYEDVAFSNIRKVTSKAMMSSLQNSAQLTHNFSFDATAIKDYRRMLKELGGDFAGVTLGDMVLFAVSRTILNYPDLNANMVNDTILRRFRHVNLGVAVDTPRGLMVPVIKNADLKSLVEISKELKDLAGQSRNGNISPDLLQGGSFTVSNMGSFGVESFSPIINPPQTGILGVCTTVDRPRADKDGIKLYPAITLSLTYDHRVLDGAPASRFVQELCANLEQFNALLAK